MLKTAKSKPLTPTSEGLQTTIFNFPVKIITFMETKINPIIIHILSSSPHMLMVPYLSLK